MIDLPILFNFRKALDTIDEVFFFYKGQTANIVFFISRVWSIETIQLRETTFLYQYQMSLNIRRFLQDKPFSSSINYSLVFPIVLWIRITIQNYLSSEIEKYTYNQNINLYIYKTWQSFITLIIYASFFSSENIRLYLSI